MLLSHFFINFLERFFIIAVLRQHYRLLALTYYEISCLSPWCRLAALPHCRRSKLFPHCHFVPIQSNRQYSRLRFRCPLYTLS